MKIAKKELIDFLKKISMSGKVVVKEANLKFESDGLKISANAPNEGPIATIQSWLKKDAFKEYNEDFGNVGVDDLPTLIKILDRFSEIITLVKEGNLLTVSGDNKKVDVELMAQSFLPDIAKANLEFNETFSTSGSVMKGIFADTKINTDAAIMFKTKEKAVEISSTGKYKFQNVLAANTCKGGVETKFGIVLIEAIEKLDGILQISLGDVTDGKIPYPIKVVEKTESSIISIIVAPRVIEE